MILTDLWTDPSGSPAGGPPRRAAGLLDQVERDRAAQRGAERGPAAATAGSVERRNEALSTRRGSPAWTCPPSPEATRAAARRAWPYSPPPAAATPGPCRPARLAVAAGAGRDRRGLLRAPPDPGRGRADGRRGPAQARAGGPRLHPPDPGLPPAAGRLPGPRGRRGGGRARARRGRTPPAGHRVRPLPQRAGAVRTPRLPRRAAALRRRPATAAGPVLGALPGGDLLLAARPAGGGQGRPDRLPPAPARLHLALPAPRLRLGPARRPRPRGGGAPRDAGGRAPPGQRGPVRGRRGGLPRGARATGTAARATSSATSCWSIAA